MLKYLWVENGIINGGSDLIQQDVWTDNRFQVEVSEELYNAYITNQDRYIYQDGKIKENPDYEQEKAKQRENGFKKEFFNTSLGWIRRKPTLADGTEDDFLNNDLPLFAINLMGGGTPILPIAYQLPDFTQELTDKYMVSLQIKNQPITLQFINECMTVKMSDFSG